jgi:hypothetical protein
MNLPFSFVSLSLPLNSSGFIGMGKLPQIFKLPQRNPRQKEFHETLSK